MNPHFSTVMLGLYIMSLCHVLWRHLHVYYIYWKNHICPGWDYPWIERKFLKNENNTLYCSISHWEEKCLFFSLLIFGLTQQRDTIDLTFCKTGQVYYRIQLNRKLRIFFVGKWCRRMKVKKAHITYIAACKVSSFCIIPFRQSSFALEQ